MHDSTGTTSTDPKLRFWRAGDTGPRVLLIMGYRMRGIVWEPQINGLKANHQVAWFDNRGVGESEAGEKPRWTMNDMAQDARAVMDSLGWETCHLVGVSMGGMVAQELALQSPERLATLSLIVTHAGGYTIEKVPTLKGLRAFRKVGRPNLNERIEALKSLLYTEEFLATVDEETLAERMKKRIGMPPAKTTAMGQLNAIVRHNAGRRLKHLQLPTLIIKAGRDILVRPSASDRLRKLIPHSKLVEIADAGHGVTFQGAERVNQALAQHFAHSLTAV